MTKLSTLSAGDWISVAARRWGSTPCFVTPTGGDASGPTADAASRLGSVRSLTFAEVDRRVTRLARAMESRGIEQGQRVAICATDSIEHVEVVLACLKAGVVFVDLNYRLRPTELQNILDRCPVDGLFYSPRYVPELAEAASSLRPGALRCCLDPGTDGVTDWADAIAYEDLVDSGTDDAFPARSNGEDLVAIAFTSGTTGVPKGVLQSERMLRNIVHSGIREVRIFAGGVRYAGAPLFHVSGIGSILYAVASGCTSLILPQFEPQTVLDWMQFGGVTSCTLIPTMISSILALPQAHQHPFPTLRGIMYGGAPMTPTLLKATIDTFGCDLYNGFGAGTEAGGQTMLFPEDHVAALNGNEHLLSSIGKPILGVDLRLCDDDLNDVAPGQVGEIVTRSETVMSGYYEQPDLTARAVVDGWFRAGDMATMDDEGYLYLATRKADMIIRGGENVYPVEIESTLAAHPAVRGVAVVGVPDEHWGEVVAAAVVIEGDDVPADDLRTFCHERLASYKVPTHVVTFDHLPTNATGKFAKTEIRRLVLERLEILDA